MPGQGVLHTHRIRVHGHAVKYLVDANVLGEATKEAPDPAVVTWLRAHEAELVIDPVVLGEIRFGIHLLPAGRKRERLEQWFSSGIQTLHCLVWDAEVGLRWARLLATLRANGQAMPVKDSLIAASALHHNLTVATRNTRDFARAEVAVVNPFVPERRDRPV